MVSDSSWHVRPSLLLTGTRADMAYCIMGGVAAPEINEGINLATGQDNLAASVGTAKFKRAALQATEAAAQSIMRACNTPNFQELAQSATFNITGTFTTSTS